MNVKNEISEELRSLSELIATISRQTPYGVADGYFTGLPERVILRIKTQDKPLTFSVPEGYFEGFAEGMLARIKESANARPEFSPMRALPETAEQELAGLSPLLAQLRGKESFRLPEGYFDELSPVLIAAKDKNPYTVPEDYFHLLAVEIAAKLPEPQEVESNVGNRPAKVVAFGGGRTNWWKYSAAAVVAGLILTIGWLRLHVTDGTHHGSPTIEQGLAKVSDQELQNFLANQEPAPAQQLNNTSTLEFNDSDMTSLLGEVPDGDLKQYLEEHGGANDIATN